MRFPIGIRKIIDTYHTPIEAVIDGWVDWDDPMGCGHFGCVWEIWSQDPAYDMVPDLARPTGRVLKLSTDATEGPVVAAIMKTGLDKKLDGLARWHGVWRIPEPIQRRPSRSTGWVIIREEISPLVPSRDLSYVPQADHWTMHLHAYNQAAFRLIRLKMPMKVTEARSQVSEALRQLFKYPETYYIAQVIDALALEGIILADIHPGNLGFRMHPTEDQPIVPVYWSDQVQRPPLLIFDPGHSQAPPVEIPNLW